MAKSHRAPMIRLMESRGMKPLTVKKYVRAMDFFCEFHNEESPEKLGLEEILVYQHHLVTKRKLAPNSVNRYLSGIRFFFLQVLGREEYGKSIPYIKVRRKVPQILSENEVKRMIDALDNVFWKVVIMVTYSAGLRNGEVRNLKTTDIDRDRMLIHIRQGKGGKCRQAILSPLVLKALEEYWLKHRVNHPVKSDQLFLPSKVSYNGKVSLKLSHTALDYMVKKAAKLAGIKKKFTLIFCGIRLQLTF